MPYYREDLEPSRCSVPGCNCTQREGEIYLRSRCHPAAPTWARYRADVVTIECSLCREVIVSLVIASREDERRGFRIRSDGEGTTDPPDAGGGRRP